MPNLLQSAARRVVGWLTQQLNRIVKAICQLACGPTLAGAMLDLSRSKTDVIAENALLRHQPVLLKRSLKRFILLFLAKITRSWRQVLLLVQPATLLRWHREGFRLFWRRKCKSTHRKPQLSIETISLIRKMGRENPLWGAERTGFRLFWRRKCKSTHRKPQLSIETISLIRKMGRENPLWGAEVIVNFRWMTQ